MRTKAVMLIEEQSPYWWAQTLVNQMRRVVEIIGCAEDAVLGKGVIYKLAHTRARCRASQSAASRTSLGKRL